MDGSKWSLSKVYVLRELAAFVGMVNATRSAGVLGSGKFTNEVAYCFESPRECRGCESIDTVMFECAV